MLPSIQKVTDVARMAGFQKQVDDFILSMNRAAEAAVPRAARFFGDAGNPRIQDPDSGVRLINGV